MTNYEKYKTAQEKLAEFEKYCDVRCRIDQKCSVDGCKRCLIEWLDLESEVTK